MLCSVVSVLIVLFPFSAFGGEEETVRQRGLFPCPGGGLGGLCGAEGRSFRSPPSRVSGRNRKRWDGKGRARLGCSPPEARPSALEEETSRGAPERAAAGVPLRESLAVFRWRTPADREIAVVAAILPSCRARGKGNPLSRTSAPRSFRKSKPCRVAERPALCRPSISHPGDFAEILRGPARSSRGEAHGRGPREARPLSPTCGFAN